MPKHLLNRHDNDTEIFYGTEEYYGMDRIRSTTTRMTTTTTVMTTTGGMDMVAKKKTANGSTKNVTNGIGMDMRLRMHNWTEPGPAASAQEKQGDEGKDETVGDYYKGKWQRRK